MKLVALRSFISNLEEKLLDNIFIDVKVHMWLRILLLMKNDREDLIVHELQVVGRYNC
jgi:hypothetical protein